MPYRKTAIAVPAELLDAVDQAARERGESRSRYITRVLRAAVRARTNAEITKRLNELFADPQVAAGQRDGARAFDEVGASFDEEGW